MATSGPDDPRRTDQPENAEPGAKARGAHPVTTGLVLIGASALALALLLSSPGSLSMVTGSQPTATPDSFSVVRAEAQSAFERGRQHYDDGNLELALIEFDRARINDPDNRADIESALQSTLEQLRARQPAAAPDPTPRQPQPSPTPYTVVLPEADPTPVVEPTAAPSSPDTSDSSPRSISVEVYEDPSQDFRLDVPTDWQRADRPEAEAGVGVVGFRTPDGRASLVISVDVQPSPVSPELYSAHLETSMRSLPGYTPERATPTLIGGAPALRRVFTVRGADPSEPVRTLQVVLARRTSMFILTASAPASQFSGSAEAFERMVSSFRVLG